MKRLDRERKTKTLIFVFFFFMLAFIVCTALQPILRQWWLSTLSITFVVISMIAWAQIRAENGNADSVPEDQLDEYERSVLDTWRKRAMKVFALLNGIGGFTFMLLGERLDTPGSTALLAAGYFMLFTFLIVYPLPMIGYAITFNRKED
ncbi:MULTISPECIES: hypothetical protein [unclassified Corynebacterium]|uniref:hypothetical protein n=1 Tax=unclassified Corynebacterium TaxID=2624378 RepID=UPI001B33B3CD|nr:MULTISPECIES: hypothetical protein [unclassified Corynebacterium]MBP3949362.1 hypothetical protein [Corynebacterium sp. Marseille-P3884]MCT1451075.1 hypothetical protein [Corynebacterium sp. p3-SID1194]